MEERILTEERIGAFASWLAKEEKSGNTIEKYVRDVRFFAAFASELEVTREVVVAYKGRLIAEGYAPRSVNSMLAAMKKLCAVAGIEPSKVFPHNLRKLFARTFYGIEKDIAKLADILGHSSINTTRIYIMTTGVEHLRKMERMRLVV